MFDIVVFNDVINQYIDDSLLADRASEKPRTYLGGSQAGKPCLRALRYSYEKSQQPRHQPKGLPYQKPHGVTGRMCRRAALGHLHEDLTAHWMISAGFKLQVVGDDGEQLGFKTAGERIAGHIDGVMRGGPDIMGIEYPLLWEHKIMKSDAWRKYKQVGVKVSHPEYFAQIQMYMGYMDLPACLFTALNTDTSDLWHQHVPIDVEYAQWASDRLLDVVNASSYADFPRIANDPSFYRCNMCEHKPKCWTVQESSQ